MLFGVVSWDAFSNLTASGLFRGATYGMLGVGFALILGVTGRFHFAYSFTYTLTAYFAVTLHHRGPELNFWIAMIIAVLLVGLVGVATEYSIYRPLARHAGANALLAVFVGSLGLGIAGQSFISWVWGSESQALFGPKKSVVTVGDVRFENFDVWQSVSALVLVIILTLLLRYTSLGRMIKATRVNPELARIIGINSDTIYLVCFFIGSMLAGVTAVWYGLQRSVTPEMGQRPVIFAFVVAFLAGTASSPLRVFFTGVLVALVENWSSMWVSARWTELVVFVFLVGYLASRSLQGTDVGRWFRRLQPAKA